jgi:hypothetical protein
MKKDASLGKPAQRLEAMVNVVSQAFDFNGQQIGSGDGSKARKNTADVLDGILKGLAEKQEDRYKILMAWLERHADDWANTLPLEIIIAA